MSNLSYNGQNIEQRDLDGYVNATQMAKANDARFDHWMGNEQAKEYLKALQESILPESRENEKLIVVQGFGANKSTWVHPLVAIAFAQWISPKFHVWCNQHIRTLLETGQTSSGGRKNIIWFDRYQLFKEKSKIPAGYFSIFGELSHTLISDFETAGHVMPENSGIDISVGKRWSDHAKAHHSNIDNLRTLYKHHYPDKRGVRDSFIYKDCLLPEFREWLEFTYKISHLYTYLKKNDKQGLITLSEMLQIQLTPSLFDMKLLN